jgi:hypothetical protein
MQKLILLSLLVANVAIPVWAARDADGWRGIRKMIRGLLVFDVAYVLALRFLYPRL